MPRRLRLQFPDALYHIINRGNFRHPVFASEGACRAFEGSLGEAAQRFCWRVHAYVVMTNHYHLAVETPEPNLATGMHWLQTTFATRYNRFRGWHGHLFQGRFKSLLIQDVTQLARVVDYIHLNPVRAGIVTPERILDFRASSLGHFIQRKAAPWLVSHEFLREAGLIGSEQLWPDYLQRLVAIATNLGDDERMIRGALSTGWAIGTSGWRKALARDQAHIRLAPEWASDELNEFRRSLWQNELECGLADLGKTLGDAADTPKSMAWKIDLARRLRTVAAPYRWIAETLNMGAPSSVRAYLTRME